MLIIKTAEDRERCTSCYGNIIVEYQYKGMLLDQLEDWQEVLDLAIKAGNTEIQEKVEKQIRKINEKLKF